MPVLPEDADPVIATAMRRLFPSAPLDYLRWGLTGAGILTERMEGARRMEATAARLSAQQEIVCQTLASVGESLARRRVAAAPMEISEARAEEINGVIA